MSTDRAGDRRPLVLLPPSKGQAVGGGDPVYAEVVGEGPLGGPRRQVLEAVTAAAAGLSEPALRRLTGVTRGDLDPVRTVLGGLADAVTLPAHHRYTGVVHGNAGLAEVDPVTAAVDVRIISPLLGLVGLAEPVPAYRLELATLPGVGGLTTFWREVLAEQLTVLAASRRVWDLLPGEHERVWPVARRAGVEVHRVRFERPDGRAANAARTKLAKGRLVAALLADPSLDQAGLAAARAGLDPAWQLRTDGRDLVAVWTTD